MELSKNKIKYFSSFAKKKVRDELNLQTGEYIQRIGEIVFDGSDDETWEVFTGIGSLNYFRIPCPTI
mgnify:CR=1 FL=1